MKIKVCGITSLKQAQQLQQFSVEFVGFIFYPRSKRFAVPALENLEKEIKELSIKKVGVFVNQPMDEIEKAIFDYGLHAVQLHGDETDEFCAELMDKAKVIKVFGVDGNEDFKSLTDPFLAVCDYFLFDTKTADRGGSGKQFNWKGLNEAEIKKPFFLSGGIGLNDVEKLQNVANPSFYAVDVNSCFELAPGKKDMDKIKTFVKGVHHE